MKATHVIKILSLDKSMVQTMAEDHKYLIVKEFEANLLGDRDMELTNNDKAWWIVPDDYEIVKVL